MAGDLARPLELGDGRMFRQALIDGRQVALGDCIGEGWNFLIGGGLGQRRARPKRQHEQRQQPAHAATSALPARTKWPSPMSSRLGRSDSFTVKGAGQALGSEALSSI